jgi:hypothetical protein
MGALRRHRRLRARCLGRRGRKLGSLVALTLWAAACGEGQPPEALAQLVASAPVVTSAIVAGTACGAGDFPATGVILYHSDDGNSPMGAMLCSGTLVAPDVVLAAGHCQELFEHQNGPNLQYYFSLSPDVSRFGPLVTHLPEDAVQVRHFLPHPDYDVARPTRGLGRAADLGLFFLAEPVTAVAPAILISPQHAGQLVAGARVTIVGYGRRLLANFSGRDGGIKHQGQSTIRSMGRYEMRVGSGDNDALKCNGDSGGPTYLHIDGPKGAIPTLVGITSRAHDWAGCRTGGIDTRVDAFLPWIEESLAWGCAHRLRASGCDPQGADLTTLRP